MTGVDGLNHITFAVSDIERSLAFYRDVLGCKVIAVLRESAYLEAGSVWICLSLDPAARSSPHPDYTHTAFNVAEDDYDLLRQRLMVENIIWNENKSEGLSTYFLDPDGHKLEIHVGSLESRLAHYGIRSEEGVRIRK